MYKFALLLILSISPIAMAEPATPDVWKPAAKAICHQIETSLQYYKKADIKNARLNAIMAYFKGYDAEMEPAARVTLGAKHVYEMEHKFRDFTKGMVENPDQKQIKTVEILGKELCADLYEEAKALDASHVPKQVFKVQ